jgi:hypothetical protein
MCTQLYDNEPECIVHERAMHSDRDEVALLEQICTRLFDGFRDSEQLSGVERVCRSIMQTVVAAKMIVPKDTLEKFMDQSNENDNDEDNKENYKHVDDTKLVTKQRASSPAAMDIQPSPVRVSRVDKRPLTDRRPAHQTAKDQYKCKLCNRVYKHHWTLYHHRRHVHNEQAGDCVADIHTDDDYYLSI